MRGYVIVHDRETMAALRAFTPLMRKAGREANLAGAREIRSEAKSRLRRLGHPAETKTPSQPGMPPAFISGELALSIKTETGLDSVKVGPTARYSRIQELGGPMHGNPYMKWVEDGVYYRSAFHKLPARPYWEPSVHAVIDSGRLTRIYRDRWRIAEAMVAR